ncbi:ATP-binding cassette domain-containing protein [Epibacterium sp. SM1969]|uniref:ATP-binding cassette domain-containing protein n=1 Tax=Tritonibacter aquimaris TaxID=2663379 RepID=A0A844AS50_9RHOB|nr:ABC transporter transmembrane domain-containing protein [Tritonibacter aquimaris]MQY43903.1 ATP-binding cassette domain-containing protein [Tritonibacter aquimaris]
MNTLTTTNASLLLQQLLKVGGWRNSEETILEAFPHMSEQLHPEEIIQTLANLKVPHTRISCRESEITDAECPALVIGQDGGCFVLLSVQADRLEICSGSETTHRPARDLTCDVVRIDRFSNQQADADYGTVRASFAALRPMMPWLLASSLLTNVLGLLAPLLIMAIYDRVIPSGSVNMLVSLAIGVVIIGATDFSFRYARTKALAYVGWRGERELTVSLFRKLMSLPLAQLQKSDINQQLSRFRQFEALREMFTGQVMTTLLDLPFALIFFAVLTYLAPAVGVFTLCLVALLVVLGFVTIPYQQRLDKEAAAASAASQAAMHDAILHQRAIADLGIQQHWIDRSLPLAEAAESANRTARQFQSLVQSVAQTITALASVGAVVISAYGALSGEMSFGALIASIALVSKVLAPLQALYSSFPQILSFRSSRVQADRVLSLPEEMELGLEQSHQKTLTGAVTFSGVTYRPDPLNAPLLAQASFKCEPGELVVVMGSDAAARTAVLDLIDGLFPPLAGTIEHDEIDIRQIATDELRKSITYATYEKSLFYGTVAQNFRLAAPSLSDAAIAQALDDMGLSADHDLLPDGADTRLNDQLLARLPEEAIKALTLARAMARPSSLTLFSEPTNGLSDARRSCFKDWLQHQKGQRTVVIATADRSFLHLADRFVFLNGERVAVHDTGDAGRKKVQAVFKALGG